MCSVTQSCLTLCDPTDCSPLGSSVHEILQARILEWVFPPPGDLPNPGIEPGSPVLQAVSLPSEPPVAAQRFYFCVYKFIHFTRKCLGTYHSGSLISSTIWGTFSIHEMKSSLISEKFFWIIILNIYSGPLFSSSLETLVMHLLDLLYIFSPSSWILSSLYFYLVLFPFLILISIPLTVPRKSTLFVFLVVWSSFLKCFCLFLLVLSWGLSVLTCCPHIFFKNFSSHCISVFWSSFKRELLFLRIFYFNCFQFMLPFWIWISFCFVAIFL